MSDLTKCELLISLAITCYWLLGKVLEYGSDQRLTEDDDIGVD